MNKYFLLRVVGSHEKIESYKNNDAVSDKRVVIGGIFIIPSKNYEERKSSLIKRLPKSLVWRFDEFEKDGEQTYFTNEEWTEEFVCMAHRNASRKRVA